MSRANTKYIIPGMEVFLLEMGSCVLNNNSDDNLTDTMYGGIEDTVDEEWDL